jgi:hypothetical protein
VRAVVVAAAPREREREDDQENGRDHA